MTQPHIHPISCQEGVRKGEVFLNTSSNLGHGQGAHVIGHRRSLHGQVRLRATCTCARPVGPPAVQEVGAQPPAASASGVDAAASPTPQVRDQHRQAVHQVACVSSLRRRRGRPTTVTSAQAVGAGSRRPGKRRCQVHRPREEVFFNTSFPPASRGHPSGVVPSTTGMEIDAPAGITAGARRSVPAIARSAPCYDVTGTPCRIASSPHR